MSDLLTKSDLADALGCFWNAAIGEAHRQQDGHMTASILATGIAAVAQRLEELSAKPLPSKPFLPTLETSTCDGYHWGADFWLQLDWTKAEWREQSSMMVAVVGSDAPPDPHWRVPHKTEGSFHRVREVKAK